MPNILSIDDLLNPKKGYVIDDKLNLVVEIRVNTPSPHAPQEQQPQIKVVRTLRTQMIFQNAHKDLTTASGMCINAINSIILSNQFLCNVFS